MSGWLDADHPGSGPVEGDGKSINGVLHVYRAERWVAHRDAETKGPAK